MAAPLSFSDVLALEFEPVEKVPRATPDVGLGLSSGVWRGLRAPAPHQLRVVYSSPLTVLPSVAQPVPVQADHRWSPSQVVALDHFRGLGADLDACPDYSAVKSAYWLLARRLHPDMAAGETSAFCRLMEAWETLRPGPRTGVFKAVLN